MVEIVEEQPTIKYLPAWVLDAPVSVLDIRQARANRRWSPHTEFVEGVAQAWNWVRTLPTGEAEAYSVKTQTSGGVDIP